jgi:hypothetical protein
MRSTRATAAIERLKVRSSNDGYSLVRTSNELFYLVLVSETGASEKLSEPLELDEFVTFVNAYGPQVPRRITKNDAAFEKQLQRKKT